MEALTEYDYPTLSVFASGSLPPPSTPAATDVISEATTIVQSKTQGSLQLVDNGSAGDPASIGVAVVLANWTSSQEQSQFATAAADQMESLLEAPRASDGAISHRTEDVELW